MNRTTLIHLAAAIAIGFGLRFVVNLEPIWWLAWFMPGLLLALALRAGTWAARGYVALAAAIGVTANVPFFLKVMPVMPVILVMTLQVLLWVFIIGSARRIVLAFSSAWTMLALPVIGVGADTALAHFTPDGNWGSLAYTQSEVLPIVQLASWFGVGGILFLLLLMNSALAFAIHFRTALAGIRPAYVLCVIAFVATAVFGWWRLQGPETGAPVRFGLVSIDDFVSGAASEKSREIWRQYDAQVTALAAGGARFILLPEKIDVLPTADAEARKAHLGRLAATNRVWLVVGLGVDTGRERRNEAWIFGPDGRLVTNYLKHFMAPPEREFVPGNDFPVSRIDEVNYGVAICKDMHFASLGRGFGARDAGVMFVPAWDFKADAWLAAHMTKLRGVENGYSVVRSSRDGWLSISDPLGRMQAVAQSSAFPGSTLYAEVRVGPRRPTLYTRIGDALGWLCLAATLVWIPWSLYSRRISRTSGSPVASV
jgi:apolipoprotein N-acyltransferase